MGAFAYCKECNAPLTAPTAEEDLISGQHCSNGHTQPRRYTLEEWIVLLYDNVIDLAEKIDNK